MNILIYCSHPAQFLFYKFTIRKLLMANHNVKLLIKSKDVLESLVQTEGFEYENILIEGRKDSKFGIIIGLLKRLLRINKIIRKFKPDILLGTDASIAQLAWLHRKVGVITLEDDIEVIPELAKLTYPFAKHIITPKACSVGKWHDKKIGYQGYMKLAYLHPNVFNPDLDISSKYNIPSRFVLVRISNLKAHHDFGAKGITDSLLVEVVQKCESNNYSVFISSEGVLDKKYDKYILKIETSDMHHILAKATLLISDSQSMSVEAAILGTPSIRFSSFAGKISVLEDLEHKYQLTFGINPSNQTELLNKIQCFLEKVDIKTLFLERKEKMLHDKIDVTAFMVWFIENYPESSKIMKENPDYQYNFR